METQQSGHIHHPHHHHHNKKHHDEQNIQKQEEVIETDWSQLNNYIEENAEKGIFFNQWQEYGKDRASFKEFAEGAKHLLVQIGGGVQHCFAIELIDGKWKMFNAISGNPQDRVSQFDMDNFCNTKIQTDKTGENEQERNDFLRAMFFNGHVPKKYPDSLAIQFRDAFESKWYIFSKWWDLPYDGEGELNEVIGIVKGPFESEQEATEFLVKNPRPHSTVGKKTREYDNELSNDRYNETKGDIYYPQSAEAWSSKVYQCEGTNYVTKGPFSTLEEAQEFIKAHKDELVYKGSQGGSDRESKGTSISILKCSKGQFSSIPYTNQT